MGLSLDLQWGKKVQRNKGEGTISVEVGLLQEPLAFLLFLPPFFLYTTFLLLFSTMLYVMALPDLRESLLVPV